MWNNIAQRDHCSYLGVQVVEQNSGEVPLPKAGQNHDYELAFVLPPLRQPAVLSVQVVSICTCDKPLQTALSPHH